MIGREFTPTAWAGGESRRMLRDLAASRRPVQEMVLRFSPESDMDRERLQWIYRSYYAGVSMVDDEAGRILDEIERGGKADNTMIVFASDYGDQLLDHGLQVKNVFFEASVRSPLMAFCPGG